MYTYRFAKPDDAHDIVELDTLFQSEIVEHFQQQLPSFVALKQRNTNKGDEIRGIAEEIKVGAKKFILVEHEKKIVGYVSGEIENKGEDKQVKQVGYVDGVYLLKKHRGRGQGKILMKKIFEWFKDKGLEYATLGVSEPNSGAIGFYKAMNFKTLGRDMVIKL